MKIDLYVRYHTRMGEKLMVYGDLPSLGSGDPAKALTMGYFNEEYWHVSLELDPSEFKQVGYRYLFVDAEGNEIRDAEKGRYFLMHKQSPDLVCWDVWGDESSPAYAYLTAPFTQVYACHRESKKAIKKITGTHLLKVKHPMLPAGQSLCLLGNQEALNSWDLSHPVPMTYHEGWWLVQLDLSGAEFPVLYKYAVCDEKTGQVVELEEGSNRLMHNDGLPQKQVQLHDGLYRKSAAAWRGAGVAIPVFSLRSEQSFGCGEFLDLKLLADWAAGAGFSMIQLLPVNDTSATFSFRDSYPYAAISAFALHPMYLNPAKVGGKKHQSFIKTLNKKRKQLNAFEQIDYEQVIRFKMDALRELYALDNQDFLNEPAYQEFFEANKHWLPAYAAFCWLRDKYKTADPARWKAHGQPDAEQIQKLAAPKSRNFKAIAFYYFLQFHLHLQFTEAIKYLHKKGIALKGDIAIGVGRHSVETWEHPELFHLDMQAGAPPDDFAVRGQNWGFPTYNWEAMLADGLNWWKARFNQMSKYFDAFRIDHILGFFRIWSIPMHAVDGILGHFVPAIPVTLTEFGERSVWFDYERLCKPYITDEILHQLFGGAAQLVREHFLEAMEGGRYRMKTPFDTQVKVRDWFERQSDVPDGAVLMRGVMDLIANVILIQDESGQGFHFRISMDQTSSYQALDTGLKDKLWSMYLDYFYHRQDALWTAEAMKKLPVFRDATEMLICGEDLGMVPDAVPKVMRQLGLLSLEIERMPKDPKRQFSDPAQAPYLSVITPSTHDMSTVRGWWEEDRDLSRRFFHELLHQHGDAPWFCEPWICRAVLLQHLYSPAMLSIFQLQDLFGIREQWRVQDPASERINIPADPQHYWRYRMHRTLEDLNADKGFQDELKDYLHHSGRIHEA